MNLGSQLEQLETAQLLRHLVEEEPAYIFRHTLTQESVYDTLLRNQRREIHRAVAQAYEKVYADRCMDEFAAILAQHYAEAGDDAKTLLYASHAGDAAFSVYAMVEAINFYNRALASVWQVAENRMQVIHLYQRLGRAYELTGDYVRALATYAEMQSVARERGDRTLEVEALILRATAYAVGAGGTRDLSKAQEVSTQARALAQELDDRRALARIYWNLLLINRFGNEGPEKAIEYGEKSLALARELGLTEQIALALKDLNVPYVVTGRLDLAKANSSETIALWQQLNNTPMLAEAMIGASQFYFSEGKLADAVRMGEEAHALVRSIDNRYGMCISGSFLWYAYREWGELQQAIAIAEDVIAIAEELSFVGGPPWASIVELAATFVRLGEFGRATEYAQRALAKVEPKTPSHPIFPNAVLANIALQQGNPALAGDLLAPFQLGSLDDYFQMNPAGIVEHISVFIELALVQKDAERAMRIADNAIKSAGKLGRLIMLPSTLHLKAKCLRKLGRKDEAYTVLNDARRQAEGMESRYQLLPILLTLIDMDAKSSERGNAAQSQLRRDEARTVIQFIAEHTPLDLRESFLGLPEIQRVLAE